MTNEATVNVETELPINFTVADGTGIEMGAILKMTDNMTAVLSDGDNDIIAGIAQSEKIASDGITSLAVYRRGIFRVIASGSISTGNSLITASSSGGDNYVAPAAVNNENIIGIALEDATDGNTFLMELNPTTMNLA